MKCNKNGCHPLVFDCSTLFSHNMRYNEPEKNVSDRCAPEKILTALEHEKGKQIVDYSYIYTYNINTCFDHLQPISAASFAATDPAPENLARSPRRQRTIARRAPHSPRTSSRYPHYTSRGRGWLTRQSRVADAAAGCAGGL